MVALAVYASGGMWIGFSKVIEKIDELDKKFEKKFDELGKKLDGLDKKLDANQ